MNSKRCDSPIVMIGLDAAEPRLLEQWMSEGTLPNLLRLRNQGGYGRLQSTADWLAGSPWATFYTGQMPGEHGLYHYLQWQPDKMAYARPAPDWLPLRPFWRDLSESAGKKLVVFDLPMTFPPEPFNGVEISGWATHDRLFPTASYPASTMNWLSEQFGQPLLNEEVGGCQPIGSLLNVRDELVYATERSGEVACELIRREKGDLFICAFGATHRGGHKLWDLTGVSGADDPVVGAQFSHALRDVYIACDAAVGKIVEAARNDTTFLVFSLHGMGPNTARADALLPKMLQSVLSGGSNAQQQSRKGGYIGRLRKCIPLEWRHSVRQRLPNRLQDRLTAYWRMGDIDWSVTPAFSLIADLQGYIRINLKGRERDGIVEPGEEYDRLCDKLIKGISTFVDADTGEPVTNEIMRVDELFADGKRREKLPDLLVGWSHSPSANHRAITSPQYGTIAWPMPGKNPDGRSGNHRPEGFLIAVGSGIQSNSHIADARIVDLAPSVYAMLGVPIPTEMLGKTLFTNQ